MERTISASLDNVQAWPVSQAEPHPRTLGDLPKRIKARITGFIHDAVKTDSALPAAELERRLVEIGFVEGATVRVAHLGGLGGDPIGVLIDERRLVALRRQEASLLAVDCRSEAAE